MRHSTKRKEIQMEKEFNFVEDIDWTSIAQENGKKLMPDVSIGYSGGDCPNRFGARTTDGGVIIWDDSEIEFLNAVEFQRNQLTHGLIVFP